jgi:aminoglycoside phosphotransferase (APT) family kinase protein
MTSATKYQIDSTTVKKLFDAAGIAGVENIDPLKAGEFNTAFSGEAGGRGFVLKIAPGPNARILSYEKDMMKQELACYDLLRERTTVGLPELYHRDFSGAIIPSPWFIMEKLRIPRLDTLKLTGEAADEAHRKLAEIAAQYHRIPGPGYGYPQNGLHTGWYGAIRSMTQNLVEDARRFGKGCPCGEELLGCIDRYQDMLKKAPAALVNFDLWENNLFYGKDAEGAPRLWMIDPERGFWGDPVADFVCLDFMHMDLGEQAGVLAAYNAAADKPLEANPETRVRYYIMLAYLGVIMYTERYSRYHPWNNGWWRNTLVGAMMYRKAFGVLTAR